MANEAKASLILELKDFASAQLSKIGQTMKKVGEDFEQSKYVFMGALGSLVAGIGVAVKEFAQEELVVTSLTRALANQGVTNKAVVEDLKSYAAALQSVTNFADDQIMAAQTQLVQFGLTGTQLKEVTKATLDFAAAKGIDLTSAATILGKAFAGETGMLQRYGFQIDENADKSVKFAQALSQITEKMGGAAAAERQTFIGQMTALKNSFGDFLEMIGSIFAPIIGRAADLLRGLLEMFKELDPKVATTSVIIVGLSTAFLAVVTALGSLLVLWPVLVGAMTTILGPLGLVSVALVGIGTVIFVLRNQFDELGKVAQNVAAGMGRSLGGFAEAFHMLMEGRIKDGWQRFKDASADAVIAIGTGMGEVTTLTMQAAENQFNALLDLVTRKRQLYDTDTQNAKAAQTRGLKQWDEYHQKLFDTDSKWKAVFKKAQDQYDKEVQEAIVAHNKKEAEMDQAKAMLKTTMMQQMYFIAQNMGRTGFYVSKALAISEAIMNTAVGVTMALRSAPPPWSFALAGTVAGLGAAQVGLIGAQIASFAEGGLVMPTAGGTISRIGEAGSKEAIIPLNDSAATREISEALGGGGLTVNINAGVLVADDESIRMFAKKIDQELFELRKNRESLSF